MDKCSFWWRLHFWEKIIWFFTFGAMWVITCAIIQRSTISLNNSISCCASYLGCNFVEFKSREFIYRIFTGELTYNASPLAGKHGGPVCGDSQVYRYSGYAATRKGRSCAVEVPRANDRLSHTGLHTLNSNTPPAGTGCVSEDVRRSACWFRVEWLGSVGGGEGGIANSAVRVFICCHPAEENDIDNLSLGTPARGNGEFMSPVLFPLYQWHQPLGHVHTVIRDWLGQVLGTAMDQTPCYRLIAMYLLPWTWVGLNRCLVLLTVLGGTEIFILFFAKLNSWINFTDGEKFWWWKLDIFD